MLSEIFTKVLNMSLTASLVIVLVLVARLALRKVPKVFSYALWAVVLFRLLCPVSLPSPMSMLGLLHAPVAETPGRITAVEYVPVPFVREEPTEPITLPERQQSTQTQPTVVQPQKKTVTAVQIVSVIWLVGCAVMALVGIGSYLRFRLRLTGAVRIQKNIYLVDHMETAFVAGLFRPRIYVPSGLSNNQMRYIIAHERCHIRRKDHITRHLAFAALCIHWFNPLVWVAFTLSGKDMEMSCDEAVIRRLGDRIRVPYAQSLLNFATERARVPGTPLAFGEVDTKARIRNIASWKKPKKWVSVLSILLCLAILTACAMNPTQNNDVAEPSVRQGETQLQTEPPQEVPTQPVAYQSQFSSTDNSVQFTMDIHENISAGPAYTAKVFPHYLTAEDAKRAAYTLFPNATFYEGEPLLSQNFSKAEIQAKLERWKKYSNSEALQDLMGETFREDSLQLLSSFIEEYTQRYEQAPEGNPHRPCEWTLKKTSDYLYEESELSTADRSRDSDEVCAQFTSDGIPYKLSVTTTNRSDFQVNCLFCLIDDGVSPANIDEYIFSALLCRGMEPSQEQVLAAREKAERYLASFDLGQWYVDECYVSTRYEGGRTEYTIRVKAVPEFQGVPAMRQQMAVGMRNPDGYATGQYLTEAEFLFSPGGNLISLSMYTPLQLQEMTQVGDGLLTMDALLSRAQEELALTDASAYDCLGMLQPYLNEECSCNVNISKIDFGLARIKAPEADGSYFYVPAITLKGRAECTNQANGKIFYQDDADVEYITLNAIDGSVINRK